MTFDAPPSLPVLPSVHNSRLASVDSQIRPWENQPMDPFYQLQLVKIHRQSQRHVEKLPVGQKLRPRNCNS